VKRITNSEKDSMALT